MFSFFFRFRTYRIVHFEFFSSLIMSITSVFICISIIYFQKLIILAVNTFTLLNTSSWHKNSTHLEDVSYWLSCLLSFLILFNLIFQSNLGPLIFIFLQDHLVNNICISLIICTWLSWKVLKLLLPLLSNCELRLSLCCHLL